MVTRRKAKGAGQKKKTWARPLFEQRALSPMSVFPADSPILCLPGDKLFQSKDLDDAYCLPPIVHAFQGNKVRIGKSFKNGRNKDPTNCPRYGLTRPAVFLSEGASLLPNPTLRSNANLPTCKYYCSRAFGRWKQCPIATMTIHHGPKTANPCKSAADKMLACSFPQTRSVPSWRCSKKI